MPNQAARRDRGPLLALLLALLSPGAAAAAPDAGPVAPAAPTVLLVVGAPGSPEYASRFRETTARWEKAAARARAALTIVGIDNDRSGKGPPDRARLEALLRAAARTGPGSSASPLWLVLVGHGTHDGRLARFNLRGPDVSAPELAAWCKPILRPLVVVSGASASAPFLSALAGPQRIVVTATKSGGELSAPRFGGYFAEAIGDARADLDRDGGVSVLEAFVHASKRVEASFGEQGLLASEHALLDDNGDGLGTAASSFQGLVTRALTSASATAPPTDGARARQVTLIPAPAEAALPPALRQRRDELETAIGALRDQRARLSEGVYLDRLERLLLDLARLYRQAGQLSAP